MRNVLQRLPLSPTSLLFASSLVVNVGNYGFNLLISRWLSPAQFAEANFLVSVLLGVSFVATAIQLTAARYEVPGQLITKMGAIGVLGLSLLAMGSVRFFHLSSPVYLWMLAVGVPFYFVFSNRRGQLQGEQHFGALAITYQVEMWVRLGIGLALVISGWGVGGVACALFASLLVTFLVTQAQRCPVLQKKSSIVQESLNESGMAQKFFAVTMLYELSQILINNSDVWLVKHYFSGSDAGTYAALSLIGRVVYFGTWSVVMVLFPQVIERVKRGLPTQPLFLKSLGLVGGIAAGIVLACALCPALIVQLLFGKNYISISGYLWLYASLTALFAIANVFVYYYLSLGKFEPIVFSVVAGLLQVIALVFSHQTFGQIIGCQLAVVSLLVLTLVIYHVVSSRSKWSRYQSAMSFIGSVTAAK